AAVINKLLSTLGAALKFASPPWVARIVQVPLVRPMMRFASILQIAGVSDVKLTGRPEDAIAYNSCGAPRDTLEIGLVMTIVWLSAVTVPPRATSGAWGCVASPPRAARMVPLPTARSAAGVAFAMHTLKASDAEWPGDPREAAT